MKTRQLIITAAMLALTGGFQRATTKVINHQAAGNGGQQHARFIQIEVAARHHDPYESVLGQVGRQFRIVGAATQPAQQPAMMAGVEASHVLVMRVNSVGHDDKINENGSHYNQQPAFAPTGAQP